MGARSEDPRPRHPSAHQVASDAASSGGDFVGKRGSGIRFPSRRKPAPVTARQAAPPHQMVSGDVPSSTPPTADRKSTRLNSSHVSISYAVFCLKKKKN